MVACGTPEAIGVLCCQDRRSRKKGISPEAADTFAHCTKAQSVQEHEDLSLPMAGMGTFAVQISSLAGDLPSLFRHHCSESWSCGGRWSIAARVRNELCRHWTVSSSYKHGQRPEIGTSFGSLQIKWLRVAVAIE